MHAALACILCVTNTLVMLPSLSLRRTFPHRLPLSSWVAQHGRAHPSGRLFWGGLKAFADGSLGSRTALFWAPYDDAAAAGVAAAHATGQRAVPLEELREMVKGAAVNGLQVGASRGGLTT